MAKRMPTTAADLFVLLDKEFRRRQPKACATCYVQLPYRVDARDAHGVNWEMVVPPGCGNGCTLVLEEVLAECQERYELGEPQRVGSRDD